ncbi:mobilization protein, partial [Streptomyces sp. SID11233]|nr:mobilization protein [Streptomyces sp. SID11233]
RSASREFARAQRSQVRAEDRVADTVRLAARDIVHTATGPEGSALAALLAAMIWSAVLAQRWHEAKGHAQQSAAARRALDHLQTAVDQVLAPTLAELELRLPRE